MTFVSERVRIANGMALVNANEGDMLIQNLNVAMIHSATRSCAAQLPPAWTESLR